MRVARAGAPVNSQVTLRIAPVWVGALVFGVAWLAFLATSPKAATCPSVEPIFWAYINQNLLLFLLEAARCSFYLISNWPMYSTDSIRFHLV
jgi:hypothetical protein